MKSADILGTIVETGARAGVARKSVLGTLQWGVAILTTAAVTSQMQVPQSWLTTMLEVLTGIGWVLFFGACVFFAIKNPDCLRSERFVIEKLAIEKTLRGDSERGFIGAETEDDAREPASLPPGERR